MEYFYLVLMDLPYNTRPEVSSENLDHELLNSEYIKKLSDVVDSDVIYGVHEVIFCSYVPFSDC